LSRATHEQLVFFVSGQTRIVMDQRQLAEDYSRQDTILLAWRIAQQG
jgi:hypothetical protein